MTAALEGGEWSAARPGRILPPGKTRYPFYRRLSGPQDWSGRADILVPTGIRSRTVQPVVSRYTDWAAGPTVVVVVFLKVCGNNVRDIYEYWQWQFLYLSIKYYLDWCTSHNLANFVQPDDGTVESQNIEPVFLYNGYTFCSKDSYWFLLLLLLGVGN